MLLFAFFPIELIEICTKKFCCDIYGLHRLFLSLDKFVLTYFFQFDSFWQISRKNFTNKYRCKQTIGRKLRRITQPFYFKLIHGYKIAHLWLTIVYWLGSDRLWYDYFCSSKWTKSLAWKIYWHWFKLTSKILSSFFFQKYSIGLLMILFHFQYNYSFTHQALNWKWRLFLDDHIVLVVVMIVGLLRGLVRDRL